MDGIASAVVLPDQDVESPPATALSPTGTKRRQSSTSETGAKRARIQDHDSPLSRRDSVSSAKVPAVAPKGRERGRERRLFGAALGALSQSSVTAAQKHRIELEKKQRAQRKLREEENAQIKQERQTQRNAQRWKEQRQFELDSMRIRHKNLLAMAHFLRTTAEPPLYYKPWETTPEQNTRIRDQIAEAHDLIRREQKDYETAHQRHTERERDDSRDAHTVDVEGALAGKDYNAETSPRAVVTNGHPTNDSETLSKHPEQKDDNAEAHADAALSVDDNATAGHEEKMTDNMHKDALDDHGEEVVEAAEDTVMY